jgi:hypothetical protein
LKNCLEGLTKNNPTQVNKNKKMKTLMMSIREDYLGMLAREGINIHAPPPLHGISFPILTTSHLNLTWARLTYIIDSINNVCPQIAGEKGVRNIVIGYMQNPDNLVGDIPDTVFVSIEELAGEVDTYPALWQ